MTEAMIFFGIGLTLIGLAIFWPKPTPEPPRTTREFTASLSAGPLKPPCPTGTGNAQWTSSK